MAIYIVDDDLEWKPIKNFKRVKDNVYEVSNYGHVRYINTDIFPNTKIANKKHHPYIAVYLEQNNGKKEWILVHQLVARFFLKIPEKYRNIDINELVPDHLDNNGLNNYYLNLEYKTRGENVSDAFRMKFIDFSGERHRDSFISDKDAHMICKMLEQGKNVDYIIKAMGFDNTKKYRSLIIRIKHGSSFKNISKKYNFNKKHLYTTEQQYVIDNLPHILNLINSGKSNSEIFDIIWKNTNNVNRLSKIETIRLIRKNKIYKEEIRNYLNMFND